MLTLLLLCAGGTVRAQDEESSPMRSVSLKAGVFLPTQGTMRDQTSAAWWAVGVDYHPAAGQGLLDGDVYVSADFFYRQDGGKNVFVMPLLANVAWDITPPDASNRVYGGLGVGAYLMNPRFRGGTVQPGARFLLGADLTDRLFVQLNYDWVSGFSDHTGASVRADGLSLLAGYRF